MGVASAQGRRAAHLASPAGSRQRSAQPQRSRCASSEATVHQSEASAESPSCVPASDIWELDFCSRPLLDERGKKLWELLITDPEGKFQYSQYFPNNKINSAEVRPAWAPMRRCHLASCPATPAGLTLARRAPPRTVQLRKSFEALLTQPGAVRPEKARFFR